MKNARDSAGQFWIVVAVRTLACAAIAALLPKRTVDLAAGLSQPIAPVEALRGLCRGAFADTDAARGSVSDSVCIRALTG